MNTYKKYTKNLLAFFALMVIVIITFNIIVDPYGIWKVYDKVGFNRQRIKSDELQRINKLVVSASKQPEVIFLGSSRVNLTLDPQYYRAITGEEKVYNLAVNGAHIYELRRFLEHAIKVSPNLREVVMGIDFFAFGENYPINKSFDDLQIGKKRLRTKNLKSFVFSLDACKSSSSSIKENYINQYEYDIYTDDGIWTAEFASRYYEKYDINVVKAFQPLYRAYRIKPQSLLELRKIIEIAKKNNIVLKVYISPVHALLLELIYASGSWEAYEEWKREIVKIIPVIDFTVYNFITTEDLTASKEFFGDISHMQVKTGKWVLDRLYENKNSTVPNDFGVLITPDNIEQHLQNIRNQRDVWQAGNPELAEKIAFFKGFLAQKPRVLMGKAEIGGEMVVRVDHLLGQSYSTKQAVLKKDAPLTIGGWGFAKGQVGKEAFLALKATDGREYYAVLDKGKRQDVADMLQNQDFVDSGFSGSSFCDDVPVGKYELRLIVLNEDQQVYSAILGEIDLCE